MTATDQLRQILDRRIAVLDGSWGVLIHRRGLSEEDYRGERLARARRTTSRATPTCSTSRARRSSPRSTTPTSPPARTSRRRTRSRRRRSARPTTTSRHLAAEMSLEGARLARAAADAWTERTPDRPRFVAGSVGPLERLALGLAEGRGPRVPRASRSRRCGERTRSRSRALAEGGVDLLLVETIFDTLNAKAAIVAARGRRAGAAALALVHRDRPQRPQPLGPDGRGVLGLGRARRAAHRRRQLLARRERDAPVPRAARARRRHVRVLLPERRPAERDGRARRGAGRHEPVPPRLRRGRPRQRRRRVLRHDAGARPADRGGRRGHGAAARSRSASRGRAAAGSSRSRSAPTRAS